MKKKIELLKGRKLPVKEAMFVVEYVKHYSARLAAEAVGYSPDHGYKLLEKEEISLAIDDVIADRMDRCMIDADWALHELVDNHMIARQQGNIAVSNSALSLLCKHKRVDAFAADKIKVSTDADVVDRLTAARKRLSKEGPPVAEDDDISFL